MSLSDSPEFSFDIYPGLDADVEAAYTRNVEAGLAEPGVIAQDGLVTAVNNTLNPPADPNTAYAHAENIPVWAESSIERAHDKWDPYKNVLSTPPPNIYELLEGDSRLDLRIRSFDRFREEVNNTSEVTPNDEALHMRIVLIPWKDMRDNLSTFDQFVKQLSQAQGKATSDDYINENLLAAIKNDHPLYFQDIQAGNRHTVSATEYLDDRIKRDGPWGVMYAQINDQAGLKSLVGKSPDDLTNRGRENLRVLGAPAGRLGIFEWIALSLQEDPSTMSASVDYSWLLANRLEVNGEAYVPCGRWSDGPVRSYLDGAGVRRDNTRPRLAVM